MSWALLLLPVLPVSGLPVSGPAPGGQDGHGPNGDGVAVALNEVAAEPEGYVVEVPPGLPKLVLPRKEKLVYRAHVEFALLDAGVGTVTQTCEVKPYQRSILLPTNGDHGDLETATLKIRARGDHSWYSMDSTIESRILPQPWPRITHRHTNDGTEKRRREVMIGRRDGDHYSSYRRDTSTGAPAGTRIWREPKYRTIPEGTIDMLGAVYLARTLIRDDMDALTVPLLDKRYIWNLTLRRGEEKRIETHAGAFDAVLVELTAEPYEGEKIKEKKIKRFEGLFGIHGTIQVWVDRTSGIPVSIGGKLPVGLISLGVEILLESYEGTPEDFAPVD